MKWFITLFFALSPIVIPLQASQADNSTAPNFGPLASLFGEWQGKDPEGKPMTVSYSVDRRWHEPGGNDDES